MNRRQLKNLLPIVFRRWNNKRYAVFSSLKKSIKIGCLLVAYLKFANPGAFAATGDTISITKHLDLEPIEISSERPPETFSSLSRVVVMVTQKEIERAAISSLNELLEFTSNIDIRQRGTEGMQADVSVRGSTFDQVLILLNGVNITDPQTGHYNLNLPLDLSAIDHIEVVKGPGSWKYGPGAFGGVLNFVTRNSRSPFMEIGVEGGSYKFNKEKIISGFTTGKVNHLISGNYSSSEGYTDNTDFNSYNLFYKGTVENEQSSVSGQAGYTEKSFGANSFYTPKYPDQYDRNQTFFASIEAKSGKGKLQLEPKAYFRRNNDNYVLFRSNPAAYSNYHTTDVWGSNVVAEYFHSLKSITFIGFDTRTETIWSNRLGEKTNKTIFSPMNDTIVLNYYHTRSNLSAFIGHKQYISKLLLNVGLNITRNTDQGFKWYLYPGIDLSYDIDGNSSFHVSANKTMRMPTFTDLYYSGPTNEGNPNLLPEESTGYEVGYQMKREYISVSATGFYSKGENLIDWIKKDLNDIWHTVNYSKITTSGLEVSLVAPLDKIMKNQKVLKQLKADYTYINQDKPLGSYISNYSMNYLSHNLDISLAHAVWGNIGAVWNLSYQDRNGQFEKFENKLSQGLVDYAPYFLCNLKVSWNYKGWNVYGMVNNLFDKTYYDIGNVVQPGRWIKLGLVKKIEFN